MKYIPTRSGDPVAPRRASAGRRDAGRTFVLRPLVAALLGLLSGGAAEVWAQTLPSGVTVVQGQATVTTQGPQMTVTNSANAALNWQSFSIGAGASVRFDQPSASSQVLNRVTGSDPSSIFGQLSSNGRVWLLNPNGILFGRDARVDVGGLVASTLHLSDADWQAQRFSLGETGAARDGQPATVVNQGELRATTGGRIFLLGGAGGVRNEGLIDARNGQVVLAAGRSVDLVDEGLPNLTVRVQAPQGEALNLGTLSAEGGRIDLSAAIVNQQGLVRADALEGGRGGEIVLRATETLDTGAASQTSARGGTGGQITLDSSPAGRTQVRGALDATGTQGQGGAVRLLGRQIGLLGGAMVDVSGEAGGGEALVGGSLQGRDPSVPHAEAVYVGPDVQVHADALVRGPGGRVVVWSDKVTRVYGSLSARGGRLGGDGGLIETSGKWLDARPKSVRADAASGKAGTWLLDPYDLTITDQAKDSFQGSPDGDYYFVGNPDGPSTLSSLTVKNALESSGGTSVNIYTSSGGPADGGDILVTSAHISVAPTTPVALRLYAARNIVFDSSAISSTGAPLDVSLNPGGSTLTPGSISFRLSTISTAGVVQGGLQLGNIQLGNGELAAVNQGGGNGSGISIDSSTLNAGAGRITGRGLSYANDVNAYGVRIGAGSVLSAADVNLQGNVVSSGSTATTVFPRHERIGVAVDGGARIDATHSIRLTGNVSGEMTLTAGASSSNTPADLTGYGVDLQGTLNVAPKGIDTTASLSVSGAVSLEPTNTSVVGLSFQTPAGIVFRSNVSTLNISGGASVTLDGNAATRAGIGSGIQVLAGTMNLAGAGETTLTSNRFITLTPTVVVAPTNATLSMTALGEGGQIDLQPASLSGSPSLMTVSSDKVNLGGNFALTGNGSTLITASVLNAQPALNFSSGGPVALEAGQITLGAGTVIRSSAGGDALRLSGRGTNLASFINEAGATALGAPNGRWLVYATDPTDKASFNAGGLDYAAVVYNRVNTDQTVRVIARVAPKALAIGAPLPDGNLLLFSVAPVLSQVDSGAPLVRTYDGTTTMPLTGAGVITGEINGDRIIGNFSDRNVGASKAIAFTTAIDGSIQGIDLNGKPVLGYQLATPFTLSGDIRPATLSYVATPTTRVAGDSLGGLTGTVQGFIAGDTVQEATTGTLQFRTAATTDSAPGVYAITGTGLSATNYTFTQSSGNTTALRLAARPTTQDPVTPTPVAGDVPRPVEIGVEEDLKLQRAKVLPLTETSSPTRGRVADALWNLNEAWGAGRAFGSVDVAAMSQDELSALLAARDRYKQSIFAVALRQLEDDPTRADAPACESIEQARAGTCLMTESLKAAYVATVQQGGAETPTAPGPAVPAPPAVAASPAATPSAPSAVSPARPVVPSPAPAPVAQAAPAVVAPVAAASALPEVLTRRRPDQAKAATLPQIQRKLALVIGIDNHTDRRVPGLDNARADATAVADVLTRRLGYETTLLTDGTRATILGQLNRLALEARAADSVVIYYAGHGSLIEKTGLGYWQPADADADRPETWIANADIGRVIGLISSNQVALISDSCYSGKLVTGERIRPADQLVSAARLLDRKAAVVMSSGGSEPVADSGKNGHSTFAWSLMRAIEKVGPWRPGANVFEQVRFAVARELPQRPQYGAALAGGHQAGADYVFESR